MTHNNCLKQQHVKALRDVTNAVLGNIPVTDDTINKVYAQTSITRLVSTQSAYGHHNNRTRHSAVILILYCLLSLFSFLSHLQASPRIIQVTKTDRTTVGASGLMCDVLTNYCACVTAMCPHSLNAAFLLADIKLPLKNNDSTKELQTHLETSDLSIFYTQPVSGSLIETLGQKYQTL